MSKLTEYNKKRNFNKTNEPEGKIITLKQKNFRYVVQYHEARAKHYDFRLEYNGVLLSWAVPKGPSLNPKNKRLAVHVEDHPLDYINFEGIIPKGEYGGGTVQIWDKGMYAPLEDMKKGLKEQNIKILLNGEKLKGEFHLFQTSGDQWLMIKADDEYAKKSYSPPAPTPTKKIVGNKNPFNKIDVQLAKLTNKIPTGKNWLYEIKYDGYRIIAFIENNKVMLMTRNHHDYTLKFGSIKDDLIKISDGRSMVLDGEMAAFDKDGKSDFGELQKRIKSQKDNFTFVIFDILALDGKDLREEILTKRKEILEKTLKNLPNNLILSSYVINKGKESFNVAKKLNLEGIIGKKLNSPYSGTRNGDWIKIKCYNSQEFVIGGYTTTEKNKILSSIIVGYYKENKLIFAGKVGTGFTEDIKNELEEKFKVLKNVKTPFSDKLDIKDNIIWLKPILVAQVQFAEFTKENVLRQASFKGLRIDKKAKSVTLEVKDER